MRLSRMIALFLFFNSITYAQTIDIIYRCLEAADDKSMKYGDYYYHLDQTNHRFLILDGPQNYRSQVSLIIREIPKRFLRELKNGHYSNEYLVDLNLDNPPYLNYLSLIYENGEIKVIGQQSFEIDSRFQPSRFSSVHSIKLEPLSNDTSLFNKIMAKPTIEDIENDALVQLTKVTKNIYAFIKRSHQFAREVGEHKTMSDEQKQCLAYFAE